MTLILTALGAKAATSLNNLSCIPTNIILPPLIKINKILIFYLNTMLPYKSLRMSKSHFIIL
jgi:hypothetical protein